MLTVASLRKQADAAESLAGEEVAEEADEVDEDADEIEDEAAAEPDEDGDEEAPAKPKPKAKAKAAPKPRKPRKPKAPPRLRARWGVFDASMKQVAIFDYKDRAAADANVVELLGDRKTGTFFLQIVKEPMPEEAAPAPARRAEPNEHRPESPRGGGAFFSGSDRWVRSCTSAT